MSLTSPKVVKSPSKRLKAVYYKLWEQGDEGFEVFEQYYENKVEKLINHFKTKIKYE